MAFRPRIPSFLRRAIPTFAALAAVLLLAGCNKLRLGYEYADWLVIYSVEDNFELDKAQRSRFKGDVENYFRWHRKSMLPLYADFLARTSDSLGRGLKAEAIDSGYAEFKRLYRGTLEPTVERATDLLMALSQAQVDQWLERQQKKNQKLRKDFSGSREEQLERRYEKTVDALEDWTGRLSKEQRRQIRSLSRALPWNGHLWLDNRERFQARLAALLKTRPAREEVRKLMAEYLLHPERLRSEEYNAKFQESETRIRAMIVRIHGLLDAKQRRHFRGQLDKMAQDFRKIKGQE